MKGLAEAAHMAREKLASDVAVAERSAEKPAALVPQLAEEEDEEAARRRRRAENEARRRRQEEEEEARRRRQEENEARRRTAAEEAEKRREEEERIDVGARRLMTLEEEQRAARLALRKERLRRDAEANEAAAVAGRRALGGVGREVDSASAGSSAHAEV